MYKLKRRLCLFAAVLICFALLVSCADEDGNVSGNASDGIVSDINSPGDETLDDNSPFDETMDISPDETPDENSPDETIDLTDDDLGQLNAFPMTFTKISDSLYRMECVAPDGNTLHLTFDKKTWGTYNIGSWSVVSDTGTKTLAGGGTDWEYVFRSGKTSSNWVWSGGNHDNELFVSIDFYNGKTDKKLSLQTGTPVDLENIKIIEKTKLHWGDPADTYCDVVRTYTVVGSRISLDVSYEYTQDCYHWLSYTCMFPVWKNYGRYCYFFNEEKESIGSVKTYKQSDPSFKDTFYKGYKATTCIIKGDINPEYRFRVIVSTVTDSLDDFKNPDKTFYWDMNQSQNKLYFSKYRSDTPTLEKAGTKFDTHSTWIFYVD
ncbi:MAG: hypothetical protein CVU97_04440 [Firmicutes bacterium HGW-Firmicutes-21]|nr:MAG: hypothetical protein CVU97_04440 [Firmicutes bacterium HGW-Firmicutes-21]